MDTMNIRGSAGVDDLHELRNHKLIVGMKQLKKQLLRGGVRRVFLARDADPAITEPLEAMCREESIHFAWVSSMTELGRACGIEVGAAAAAVLDS